MTFRPLRGLAVFAGIVSLSLPGSVLAAPTATVARGSLMPQGSRLERRLKAPFPTRLTTQTVHHHRTYRKVRGESVARAVFARVVQTTSSLSNALAVKAPRAFVITPAPASAIIHVNPTVHYQSITGFGAAMTDTSAWLLHNELTPEQFRFAMQALFSAQGIHLDYVRIPMAATDFTATGHPYTYDDQPAGQTDPQLANFSIAHDQAYVLPTLRAMLAINPSIFTLATPWTPPPWMKTNHAYDNERLAGTVDPQYYPALAGYFRDFLLAYKTAGVPVNAITMMNEPNSLAAWPGAAFSAAEQASWLPQYLKPTLDAAGLRPEVFGVDDTRLSDAETLLSSSAAQDLTGVAFHCYQGMASFSAFHYLHPDVPILENECSPGLVPYSPAEIAIDATRNWASGVQLWNLALDPSGGPVQAPNYGCGGCTGLITVDESTQKAIYGLSFYAYGQMSKYVMPGAQRIYSTRLVSDVNGTENTGTDDVAFENPNGSTVLVATNNSTKGQRVAIDAKGRYLNWTLGPGATVTFVWHF